MRAPWAYQRLDPRRLDAEDGSIQKEQRAQRLLMSRCAGAASGDVFEKSRYF
jgi:hypothetical protein